MKTITQLLTLSVFFLHISAIAEEYETDFVQIHIDNHTFELEEGETAELVGVNGSGSVDYYVKIGSRVYSWAATRTNYGATVTGPVTISLKEHSSTTDSTIEDSLVVFKISRKVTTTASVDPPEVDYENINGWLFFSDFPWVFSNSNKSWYYFAPTDAGLFAYNDALPGNGWKLVEGRTKVSGDNVQTVNSN